MNTDVAHAAEPRQPLCLIEKLCCGNYGMNAWAYIYCSSTYAVTPRPQKLLLFVAVPPLKGLLKLLVIDHRVRYHLLHSVHTSYSRQHARSARAMSIEPEDQSYRGEQLVSERATD